jgi:phosphoglycolate phosphatase
MRRQALLFDLDGTLVDSLPDLAHAINLMLAEEGLPTLSLPMVRLMIGDGAKKLVERALRVAGRTSFDDLPARVARFLELYEDGPAERTVVYPGVADTLAEFRRMGLKLAVVTNKPQEASLKVLAGLGIGQYFDTVVGADGLLALKPDPAPLMLALTRLQSCESEAVMIGDNANDVAAAKALGIPVIAVAYGYARCEPKDLGADLLIERFDDLSAALRWFPG